MAAKSTRIVTWNINSVRLRLPIVLQLLEELKPDVLCLQEIKCTNEQFPAEALAEAGYPHQALNGIKAYHGVATIAREPFANVEIKSWVGKEDGRHVMTQLADGTEVHNFYVPAGGDEPDREKNDKFGHKLDFLTEMTAYWAERSKEAGLKAIKVGDLNIAPLETDVWNHKQLLKVVSHTPLEVDELGKVQSALSWFDAIRNFIPPEEKLYTWWSYRAKDWSAADKGRRLDHIWVTEPLQASLLDCGVLRDARGWEKPSDHAPVWLDVNLG
ncbi:MAG: exodeoxyribonuclease III [Alphaproteobacteria bacterium]|jgi:exodeoxyribonuclease-3